MAGVSLEAYRVKIGCFASVAALLSCVKARCPYPYTHSLNTKSKAYGVVIRLSFVVLFLAVTGFLQQCPLVLDLTRFGDVEKNPGPDKDEIFFTFHEIGPLTFEKLAGFVVHKMYGFPVLLFSDGRDGGRDAVGIDVNIKQNDGTILKHQNVIVQVKHTKNASEKLTKAKRGSVFGKEVKKVKELVQKKELDTYVIVTNYPVPGEQEGELKSEFEGAGAKHVIVIGYETLSEWLYQYPDLRRDIAGLYGVGNAQSLNLLKLYKDQVTQVTHYTAFTNAEKKLKEGLVFVIGPRRSGKTTVAKYLADKLSREYVFFHILETSEFTDLSRQHRKGKVLYFVDDVDQGKMEKWCELKDELKSAMDDGSKFVFTGSTEVYEFVKQKSELLLHLGFYYQFCVGAIDLSDQSSLSSVEKREMLTNHIKKGDHDKSKQEALLKSDMLQHASERISCTCFPEVAYRLGTRDCVEKFWRESPDVPKVYDKVFLDKFFWWVEDIVSKDKNSTAEQRIIESVRNTETGIIKSGESSAAQILESVKDSETRVIETGKSSAADIMESVRDSETRVIETGESSAAQIVKSVRDSETRIIESGESSAAHIMEKVVQGFGSVKQDLMDIKRQKVDITLEAQSSHTTCSYEETKKRKAKDTEVPTDCHKKPKANDSSKCKTAGTSVGVIYVCLWGETWKLMYRHTGWIV